MVNHKESETEFSVLQHSDNMKRISTRTMRYFYGPIEGTPFSLALALPEKYGMHELNAQQEIRRSPMNGKKSGGYCEDLNGFETNSDSLPQ